MLNWIPCNDSACSESSSFILHSNYFRDNFIKMGDIPLTFSRSNRSPELENSIYKFFFLCWLNFSAKEFLYSEIFVSVTIII